MRFDRKRFRILRHISNQRGLLVKGEKEQFLDWGVESEAINFPAETASIRWPSLSLTDLFRSANYLSLFSCWQTHIEISRSSELFRRKSDRFVVQPRFNARACLGQR